MKISIGMNLQSGPWGGGNQFGCTLTEYLCNKGIEVSFDLSEPKLDLIILTEPRSNLKSSAYSDKNIIKYLLLKNRRAIVVHRINECDERKGTNDVNKRLINANFCANYTVFISSWLQELFLAQHLETPNHSVILNGANLSVFNAQKYKRWDKIGKLRFVTHHWGGGHLKGFDIYKHFDDMLSEPRFSNKLEFTYIGNLPDDIQFNNVRHIPPQSGIDLANSISSHHIYLTASRNEPAGMHHIEGALCGLPLLYRESGALPEYCSGFGVPFKTENFDQKLQEMVNTYDQWADRMKDYPHTAEKMCEDYYNLFVSLIERRNEILKQRKWLRGPLWLLRGIR